MVRGSSTMLPSSKPRPRALCCLWCEAKPLAGRCSRGGYRELLAGAAPGSTVGRRAQQLLGGDARAPTRQPPQQRPQQPLLIAPWARKRLKQHLSSSSSPPRHSLARLRHPPLVSASSLRPRIPMPYNTTAIPPRREPTGQTQLPRECPPSRLDGTPASVAVA